MPENPVKTGSGKAKSRRKRKEEREKEDLEIGGFCFYFPLLLL
jgi:hypothetical protein